MFLPIRFDRSRFFLLLQYLLEKFITEPIFEILYVPPITKFMCIEEKALSKNQIFN